MKTGLFIASVLAFMTAFYFLISDLLENYSLSHFVYLLLLVIIMLNSIAGIFMTWPNASTEKSK